jgi:hypothetical protein
MTTFVIIRNCTNNQLVASGLRTIEEVKRYLDDYARDADIVDLQHMIVIDSIGNTCVVGRDGKLYNPVARHQFQDWYRQAKQI